LETAEMSAGRKREKRDDKTARTRTTRNFDAVKSDQSRLAIMMSGLASSILYCRTLIDDPSMSGEESAKPATTFV
jgi:hypothetical protein